MAAAIAASLPLASSAADDEQWPQPLPLPPPWRLSSAWGLREAERTQRISISEALSKRIGNQLVQPTAVAEVADELASFLFIYSSNRVPNLNILTRLYTFDERILVPQ